MSASGIFFQTDRRPAVGRDIHLTVELESPTADKMLLECLGRIVRLESQGSRLGVAVRIVQATMKAAGRRLKGGGSRLSAA